MASFNFPPSMAAIAFLMVEEPISMGMVLSSLYDAKATFRPLFALSAEPWYAAPARRDSNELPHPVRRRKIHSL